MIPSRKFKGATKKDEKHKHDGNIVFAIRKTRTDKYVAVTGFDVEQLHEILEIGSPKGRDLAARHTWGLREIPGIK